MFFFVSGYYAEHIATDNDARSNSTIRVKTDSKGIHLHNLSYAGPIVMGCGGKMSHVDKQYFVYILKETIFLPLPKCHPYFHSLCSAYKNTTFNA